MKYVEHFEETVSFHNVAKIWRGVLFQSVMFVVLFTVLSELNYFKRTFPELGFYTFYAGMLFILPSIFILFRFHLLRKRIKNKYDEINKQFILIGDDAKHLKGYMVAGILIADLMMLCGVAHIVLTANLGQAAYLWIASLFFCLNYKPCVRFINCSADGTCSIESSDKENP